MSEHWVGLVQLIYTLNDLLKWNTSCIGKRLLPFQVVRYKLMKWRVDKSDGNR